MPEETPLRQQLQKASEFDLQEYNYVTHHSVGSLMKERKKVATLLLTHDDESGHALFNWYNTHIKELLGL